jgi:nucleotide-binding universal stress UspA family protein
MKVPQMRSMLVPYNGSALAQRALQHAADLVGPGGDVAVIHVIAVQSVSSRLQTVSEKQQAEQDSLLREAEEELARRGVKAQIVRAAGDPATEILAAAAAMEADVIVVGRRRGLAKRVVRGSLSGTLVRRAASDVLVVH